MPHQKNIEDQLNLHEITLLYKYSLSIYFLTLKIPLKMHSSAMIN